MATKLEKLLEEIDPSRTIDVVERRINDALAHHHLENNRVDSWEEHKCCLAEMAQLARNAALHLPSNFGGDIERDYHEAIHYLQREYGSIQTIYDIMRSGAEGGIYGICRSLARLMAEELSQDEVKARVSAYWRSLSVDEQLAAPDEYIVKYKDILPQKIKEEAFRLKIAFWKVLDDHPRMLRRIRGLKYPS